MKKVRIVFLLGLFGFLVHLFFAIAFFATPQGLAFYLDISSSPISSPPINVIFLIRLVAILMIPLALAYLFAMIYQDAARPLLMVATCEKVVAVICMLPALFAGTLDKDLYPAPIMDGIFALAGIYAVVVTRKQKPVN